jgi:hypothetical protein
LIIDIAEFSDIVLLFRQKKIPTIFRKLYLLAFSDGMERTNFGEHVRNSIQKSSGFGVETRPLTTHQRNFYLFTLNPKMEAVYEIL